MGDSIRMAYELEMNEHRAALKIQLLLRRRTAKRRVEDKRKQWLREMDKAATYIRKIWLGQRIRKRFKALMAEFSEVQTEIKTIQRYMRGCLCRLKLWREAVRAEEEIWAAVSMQRVW